MGRSILVYYVTVYEKEWGRVFPTLSVTRHKAVDGRISDNEKWTIYRVQSLRSVNKLFVSFQDQLYDLNIATSIQVDSITSPQYGYLVEDVLYDPRTFVTFERVVK